MTSPWYSLGLPGRERDGEHRRVAAELRLVEGGMCVGQCPERIWRQQTQTARWARIRAERTSSPTASASAASQSAIDAG